MGNAPIKKSTQMQGTAYDDIEREQTAYSEGAKLMEVMRKIPLPSKLHFQKDLIMRLSN